uniref:Uncharacterized protein n=1 Tax=Arundo donax TaxID=35708 RepID=A0A0A9FY01_ARUDO
MVLYSPPPFPPHVLLLFRLFISMDLNSSSRIQGGRSCRAAPCPQ